MIGDADKAVSDDKSFMRICAKMQRPWIGCVILFAGILFSLPNAADAQTTAESSAEGAGMLGPTRRAQEEAGGTPWFDAESGSLVPIPLQTRVDDSVNRKSRWLPRPKTVRKSASTSSASQAAGTSGTGGGSGLFGSSLTIGNLFGWVLLAVICVGIVGGIVYAISRAELGMAQGGSTTEKTSDGGGLPDEQLLERIKHLPPELRRTDVNLRTECERLMKEGRFDQAIILMLGHQLLLLDRHGMLRLSRGKTNGRYVRETKGHDETCAMWLRETTDAFEQSYFGRHEIPPGVFSELWTQNQQMETAVDSLGGHG